MIFLQWFDDVKGIHTIQRVKSVVVVFFSSQLALIVVDAALWWLGGIVVRSRTSDSEVVGFSPTRTAVE